MPDDTQSCPRCEVDLPLEAFPERYRGKPGNYCGACMRAYMRAWKAANPSRRPLRTTECVTEGCTTRVQGDQTQCVPHRPRPSRVPHTLSTTYAAVHKRLRTALGKASDHTCVHDCGYPARDWAYDHRDPGEITGENQGKSVAYSVKAEHYIPLCRVCHMIFDHRPHQRHTA